jgi:hypothetical protein
MFVLAEAISRLRKAQTRNLPDHLDAPPARFCTDVMVAANGDLRKAYEAVLPSPRECC